MRLTQNYANLKRCAGCNHAQLARPSSVALLRLEEPDGAIPVVG